MNEAVRQQAEAYRSRAEELRSQADGTPHPESKEALYRLARGYDRLADNLDRVVNRSLQFIDAANGTYAVGNRPRLVSSR